MMLLSFISDLKDMILVGLVWLFSPSSSGILTLVTGGIALLVYRHQIKLREEEAAIVLLNEIRRAERVLALVTSPEFDIQNESISILPNCSWDRNHQIFARYMSRDDFELLGNFFDGCKAAQSELEQGRHYFLIAREEKGREIQRRLLNIAEKHVNDQQSYNVMREKIINLADREDFIFRFSKPITYFSKYVSALPKISGTTVMESLRKIAKER